MIAPVTDPVDQQRRPGSSRTPVSVELIGGVFSVPFEE
jgi:hypothetical protein